MIKPKIDPPVKDKVKPRFLTNDEIKSVFTMVFNENECHVSFNTDCDIGRILLEKTITENIGGMTQSFYTKCCYLDKIENDRIIKIDPKDSSYFLRSLIEYAKENPIEYVIYEDKKKHDEIIMKKLKEIGKMMNVSQSKIKEEGETYYFGLIANPDLGQFFADELFFHYAKSIDKYGATLFKSESNCRMTDFPMDNGNQKLDKNQIVLYIMMKIFTDPIEVFDLSKVPAKNPVRQNIDFFFKQIDWKSINKIIEDNKKVTKKLKEMAVLINQKKVDHEKLKNEAIKYVEDTSKDITKLITHQI